MKRLLILAGAISFLSVAPISTVFGGPELKTVKIRGYVTEVVSDTVFEIEDYRITRDAGFVFDFENVSPELKFSPENIRVGVELEIKGLLNQQTGELTATSIKVDMEQFKKTKRTAILAKSPSGVSKTEAGWVGQFYADGQRIVVDPQTVVAFKLTSRERKLQKQKAKSDTGEGDEDEEFRPLSSLEEVAVGMAMTYEGQRSPEDGSIRASRVEFAKNDLEEGEAKLWKSLKVSTKPAQALKPGELKIDKVGKFKLLPSDEVQQYVGRIGHSLVPAYQRELPPGTPEKIPFEFFVVINKEANAFALPNGKVVVHSGLLSLFENEAQLAAVLGHEIAHSVQEHTWRQQQYHKKKRFALAIAGAVAAAYGKYAVSDLLNMVQGAIQNGHSRSLENQADRLGLEYMVSAGYDPREAPRVWKLMTQKYGLQTTNFFWSSHENQATRRSYLMNELKNNYRELDYGALTRGEDEFKRVQMTAAEAAEAKARLTIK